MCFSAGASFFTAALTGASGLAALQRTTQKREWPLAVMPLFFAVQQSVEGSLWMALPVSPQGPVCLALTNTFLLFAFLFWPIFAPLAALCLEDDKARFRAILACTLAGASVSAYLATVYFTSSHQALLQDGHIVYNSIPPPDPRVGVFYLAATGLAPALSSHRALNLLSIIVVIGSVVAWLAYWDAYVSVWCFFSAAASAVILVHFERARTLAARQSCVR